MGATDSKLQFKNHIFKLFEISNIPKEDEYWEKFWQQPDSAEDVFTLFTAGDIRSARDLQPDNLEILITAVCNRLFVLYAELNDPSRLSNVSAGGAIQSLGSASQPDGAEVKELLNCLRLLTRIIPFLFEVQNQNPRIRQLIKSLFWMGDKVLAKRIIDIGTDLLFKPGFTVADTSENHNVIWDTGVGCTTPMTVTHDAIQNRVEVLRFLLALSSDCLYTSPNSLATQGSPFVSYMVSRQDKHRHEIMAVLCSLLNTCMKYSPGWKVPYDHVLISDRSRQLVAYSLQYLLLLLIYSPPPSSEDNKNWYRHYLSKIYRPQDLQFLADSLTRLLSQPISASSSYLPGSQRQIQWVTELCMLFWDLFQCNKKFLQFLLKSGHIHDFVVLLLYYANDRHSDIINKASTVRLCVYVLLHLTSDADIARSLSQHRFEGQGFLPSTIKLSPFNGNYADYLIIQLVKTVNNLLLTGPSPAPATGRQEESSSSGLTNNAPVLPESRHLVSNILNCIYNISPYVSAISYPAASALVHLLMMLSSAQNASSSNSAYLSTVIQSLKMLLEYHFKDNKKLVFVILKNEKSFRSIHAAAAKGKNREATPQHTSILADMALVLDWFVSLIEYLEQCLPYAEYFTSDYSTGAGSSGSSSSSKLQPHVVIESIGSLQEVPEIDIKPHEPDSGSDFESFKFSWTSDSLGWYESILWGSIYRCESQVGNSNRSLGESAVGMHSTAVGVWNGTQIKLFKLQEVLPQGPSILRPKGAVDAVADSMIKSFSKFTNRNSSERNRENGRGG